MTTEEAVTFTRSRGVRFAPVAGLLGSASLMTRGSENWILAGMGAAVFALSVVAVWWAWMVPLATFSRHLIVWKELPQRRPLEVDLNRVSSWRYHEETNTLELLECDGRQSVLNLNAMSRGDVPRLLGLVEELDVHTDQAATGEGSGHS